MDSLLKSIEQLILASEKRVLKQTEVIVKKQVEKLTKRISNLQTRVKAVEKKAKTTVKKNPCKTPDFILKPFEQRLIVDDFIENDVLVAFFRKKIPNSDYCARIIRYGEMNRFVSMLFLSKEDANIHLVGERLYVYECANIFGKKSCSWNLKKQKDFLNEFVQELLVVYAQFCESVFEGIEGYESRFLPVLRELQETEEDSYKKHCKQMKEIVSNHIKKIKPIAAENRKNFQS